MVLTISAKTLDAKISLDAVVQKEGNLGVWGVRQDKAVNTYLLNSIYFSGKKDFFFFFPEEILNFF